MGDNHSSRPTVWAAGAVALREGSVALVHRARYDDWTLAKGKADSGELLVRTAVREVREETGLAIRLGPPLTPSRYFVDGALKLVSWWRGHIVAEGARTAAADEVDQVEWLPPIAALARLTYASERELLLEALACPATTPLLLVRHARAVKRHDWAGADRDRPLSDHGRAQLPFLGQLLGAYGVVDLVTSPAARCRETVAPYAESAAATLSARETLTEEAGEADPLALADFVADLATAVAHSRLPAAVCVHRPNLPTMLTALGLPPRPVAPGAVVVAHVAQGGAVWATEWHESSRALA
ncbi:MAG: NUDIX hydrolase [Propionibacteriaceae bacterium]|jgi:8-oxo-dGTP diphosphatase|nr:NUDIX hydrolase [Propionibacteriaceae bacterium]